MCVLENRRQQEKKYCRHCTKRSVTIFWQNSRSVDTVIGAKGVYVSGGEAQRISIARAMLKNASILILDEATAFADPDNEVRVQEAFARLSKGKTLIMIAHRLSTIVNADCIYVIKDGTIDAQGTHAQLLEQQGLYADMWQEYNRAAQWKVGEKDA